MLKKLNLIQIQTILSAMQIEDFAAGKDIDPRCCVKAVQLPSPRGAFQVRTSRHPREKGGSGGSYQTLAKELGCPLLLYLCLTAAVVSLPPACLLSRSLRCVPWLPEDRSCLAIKCIQIRGWSPSDKSSLFHSVLVNV